MAAGYTNILIITDLGEAAISACHTPISHAEAQRRRGAEAQRRRGAEKRTEAQRKGQRRKEKDRGGHRKKIMAGRLCPASGPDSPGPDRTADIRLSDFSRLYPPLNPL